MAREGGIPGVSVTIRPATIGDAAGIAAVHVRSWRETYPGLIPQDVLDNLSVEQRTKDWQEWLSKQQQMFVAHKSEQIVGFVAGGKSRKPDFSYRSELYGLYLLQETQGSGVGRSLFETLGKAFQDQNTPDFYLWVIEGNTQSRQFYERMGGQAFSEKIEEERGYTLKEIAYGWPNGYP
jgi:ribosomal protein S18 acetylase RimI-like enzyme